MNKDKMFDEVTVGDVFKRRDGKLAYCYGYSNVYNHYLCIVQDSGETFSVNDDGSYYECNASHNDLVERVK